VARRLASPPKPLRKLCGDHLERLQQAHAETPLALGLSSDGGLIEVVVAPEGGWTMLLTYPRRPTCVVATGEAWEMQLAGQPT
jgi:hypothetical protein